MRREILALEAHGAEVIRVAARPFGGKLVEPGDKEEARRTLYLTASLFLAFRCAVHIAITRPGRFMAAIRDAIRIGRSSPRGVMRHLFYIGEASVLIRVAQGTDHIHANFSNATTIATFASVLGCPPVSLRIHGPEEYVVFSKPEWIWKSQHAAFIAPISEYGYNTISSLVPTRFHPKIHIHRCGVGETLIGSLRKTTLLPLAMRVVCVARLEPRKGHEILLQAMKRLHDEGFRFELDLVGDGSIRDRLQHLVQEMNLANWVKFSSWQSEDQVIEAIKLARVFVLPSFAEGLPIVLMEAFSLGRAVVATGVAGIPELVIPGETGWLVEPGDVNGLASSIKESLTAPDHQLCAMAAAGLGLVQKKHSAHLIMRDMLASIKKANTSQPD